MAFDPQNTLDACLGGIVWWIFGYPLAYGDPNKDFYSSFIAGGVRSFLPSNAM